MADTLLRSPSSRHAGAFRTRKTLNEPSQKDDSPSFHQISKLVTGALGLSARSNPNWRTRPKSDDSQGRSHGHQGRARARRHKMMASSSNVETKSRHASGKQCALYPNANEHTSMSPQTRDREYPDSSADQDYYQVYKHIELGPFGIGGAQLSLIDLSSHQCDDNSDSLVKVRRLPKRPESRPRVAENTQKEQLKAALQAGAETPRKGPSMAKGHPSSNKPPVSAEAPDMQMTATNMANFDVAFQKMLQKLTRNVEQDRKDGTSVKTEHDQTPKPRHPMPNIGRRMNTVSDPCYVFVPSQPQSHKKEDTKDSGVCVEENCKSNLNPRAREFLTKQELMSAKNKGCPTILGDGNELFGPKPLENTGACKHQKDPAAVPASPEVGKPSMTEAAPPPQLIPKGVTSRQTSPVASSSHPVMTYGFAPLMFNNFLPGGSLFPFVGAEQTPAQCLGPASTALTALPALSTQAVLQPVMRSPLGFPPTPLLNPVFPTMNRGHINPCLVGPVCPLPVLGSVAARPPPVPKPRRPDPKDQQLYEAWIEWRKANEPGYALECKLRQQRRAQRSVANPSKPNPEKRMEASKSA